MFRYFIPLVAVFMIGTANGQTAFNASDLNAPPSPNASSLIKYANVPVSLYSGTPHITVPIVNLDGKGVTVPVSLEYHASGIKVQDIASWVGLGWSLNAGGIITRIVRGLPDESANGYCGSNYIGYKSLQNPTQEYVSNVSKRIWDGEPDLFYFNFLGMTGKFVLDYTGRPCFFPSSNFKVTPGIGLLGAGKWTFQDVEGVKYIFGNEPGHTEISSSSKSSTTASESNYVSSWYLSKVEYPNGEVIDFSYSSGSQVDYKYFVQSLSLTVWALNILNNGCVNPVGTPVDNNIVTSIASPKYLSQIQSSVARIEFVQATNTREDLSGGKYLQQILVYDNNDPLGNNDRLIQKFRFNYSYFQSDGCSTELCKRLKLNSVEQITGDFSSKIGLFEYNSTNLPSRDSHSLDHWGYYNSNTFSSKIPSIPSYSGEPCFNSYSGADKSPDSIKTKANILTKILLPTGGTQEFVYSANSYYDESANTNNFTGGVRILKMIVSDGAVSNATQYYYTQPNSVNSSGRIAGIPKYAYGYYAGSLQFFQAYRSILIFSHSLTDLFDLNGYHVGYGFVRVKQTNNGYTDNYFTNFTSDHTDDLPEQFSFQINQLASYDPLKYPFTPRSSKSYERGILTQRDSYNKNSKLLVSEIYNYKFDLPVSVTMTAYKSGLTSYSDAYQDQIYSVGKYRINTKPILIDNVRTIAYDQSTANQDLTANVNNITEYSFNATTLLPIQTTLYNNAQPSVKLITKTKYVSDYSYEQQQPVDCVQQLNNCNADCANEPDSQVRSYCYMQCASMVCEDFPGTPVASPEVAALISLSNEHKWSMPVEITLLSEEDGITKLVSSTTYKYLKQSGPNNYVKPVEVFQIKRSLPLTGPNRYKELAIDPGTGTLSMDDRMRPIKSFDQYDGNSGNVLQATGADGIQTSYEWTEYDSKLKSITLNAGTSLAQKSEFSYKSGVGLTSVADANSRKSFFEYDGFNRLKIVKDHDLNIVKRYRYNLKSDNNSLEAIITVSGSLNPNSTISFISSINGEQIGATRYVWDFGDGQVQDLAAPNVTHVYTTAGTYIVKLSKVNAEYGSVTVTKTVSIYPPPTVLITSTTTSVNVCDDATAVLSATVSSGCPGARSYTWSYSTSSSSGPFNGTISDTSSSIEFTSAVTGTYYFRCVATNECQQQASNVKSIVFRESPAGCGRQK